MAAAQPKTEEERDEEELRDVESKLTEVLDLMTARHSRDRTDVNLEAARIRRHENTGNIQSVFHVAEKGGHHVPTTMHTKATMDLADQLKTRIKLGKYARELQDSLHRLSERHIAVLERILARSRY
jgi:hypothetical protein